MRTRLILIILLALTSSVSFAQASWSYTIKFKLVTRNNKTISKKDFIKGKVKLLSNPLGAHVDNKLVFDATTNSFTFSQHTITTGATLVFITKSDTTILNIATTNLDLGIVQLTGKEYSFQFWNYQGNYIEDIDQTGHKYWKLKAPLESYLYDQEDAYTSNVKSLVKVKIHKAQLSK